MCVRGDIFFVDFGPETGSSKQCGQRPVVVVSNNKANTHSPVVTVVPLTSRIWKKRHLPTHVLIPQQATDGLDRDSMALAEQVEALDKNRLISYKGHVRDRQVMAKITQAIQVQIGVYNEYNDF